MVMTLSPASNAVQVGVDSAFAARANRRRVGGAGASRVGAVGVQRASALSERKCVAPGASPFAPGPFALELTRTGPLRFTPTRAPH